MKIAFLGTGLMGGPMAKNLAVAGFKVSAWNRTPSKAAFLIAVSYTHLTLPTTVRV